MVTRHGAKKFIISVLPEIEKRLEAGYTIKEIHADLPELANNISYSSVLRNLSKMGISEKKPHSNKIEKSVNLDTASSSSQKITDAQRNLEKLQKRPEKFKFDHGTNDKELI
ncbi:hypothetical protein [Acinetobacter haemolyticus]|jgi:hypothetical protein|uniref:Uncharacterized protein n=1 Tax=Acinetobacter haemolyticus TaxID=29430 RepID=A0A857IQA5_ACIHA|nr:hypothetical protein [Acinetobacter haemolyticus]QHI11884.1 hypothetical protein AhaeAN59_17785 [Acinetobacter haemolyticus]QHI15132.1 hypothetical protein AhaeAN43_17580 [Acinetobacter haemolyticus]